MSGERALDLAEVGRGGGPAALAAAFAFPAWFGGTWDSVEDCLREHAGTRLRLGGFHRWRRRDPHGARLLRAVCRSAGVVLVLAPGAGPATPPRHEHDP